MDYQAVFQRRELKYLLTREQMTQVLEAITPHMVADPHGPAIVRNLYFDTDSYRLIRRSIEKPVYKEKLRLRSYVPAGADDPVFVEVKKKYKGVVYKRRMTMAQQLAIQWLTGAYTPEAPGQIGREIDYFRSFYGPLKPVCHLSYRRLAFQKEDFRVTFDDQIQARTTDFTFASGPPGTALLPENLVLMELKCVGGMPLWMAQTLSRLGLYKTSFSKYGTAYQTLIYPHWKGTDHYG